jgi:hypothetical protein
VVVRSGLGRPVELGGRERGVARHAMNGGWQVAGGVARAGLETDADAEGDIESGFEVDGGITPIDLMREGTHIIVL